MADQTSAGFHSYAKPRKRTGDDENRRPSFLQLHGYAAQRKRDRGSPTGHTPHSKSKRPSRPALSEMGQLQKEAKKKWTNEESQFLIGKANTTLLHTITFWKKCAADLNEEFGTSRSDVSCRLQYMRLKKEGSASLDTGIQEIEYPKTADKASQTDLTVPVLRQQANFNEWEKDDSGPKEKAETMSHGSKILLTSLQGMKDKHNIDELSFNEVLNTLLSSNDLIDLTRSIYDVKSLRENLWKMFLEDICESARCMCEKRKSVLYHKDYLSLKTFEWRYILEEMVGENKRLTEVLLSVSMPKRKATISHAEKLVKTLGFVYGVLMKCRWKDLSLIQRLVSMVMFDEKVHQKVKYIVV